MAVLYVDECGEEGFSPTSSEWLILGGVLQPHAALQPMIEAYDEFKATHCQDNWHFHFQKASHDLRLAFIEAFKDVPFSTFAVAIYKDNIEKRDNFQKKYYLYFYALRFLLERATKHCKEHCGEELAVYLSARRGLEAINLGSYLAKVFSSPFTKQDKMEWDYLKLDHIYVRKNLEYRGLQVADCVASSVGKALEPSNYGTLEPRYLRDLHPGFHRNGLNYDRAITRWPGAPLHVWERYFWK